MFYSETETFVTDDTIWHFNTRRKPLCPCHSFDLQTCDTVDPSLCSECAFHPHYHTFQT